MGRNLGELLPRIEEHKLNVVGCDRVTTEKESLEMHHRRVLVIAPTVLELERLE